MGMRTERKRIGTGREVGGNRERRGQNWKRRGEDREEEVKNWETEAGIGN